MKFTVAMFLVLFASSGIGAQGVELKDRRVVRNLRFGDAVKGFLQTMAIDQGKELGRVCGQLVQFRDDSMGVQIGNGACPPNGRALAPSDTTLMAEAVLTSREGDRCSKVGCYTLYSDRVSTLRVPIGTVEGSLDTTVTEFGPVAELATLCSGTPAGQECRPIVRSDGSFGGVDYNHYAHLNALTLAPAFIDALEALRFNRRDLPCVAKAKDHAGGERLVLGYVSSSALYSAERPCVVTKAIHQSHAKINLRLRNGVVKLVDPRIEEEISVGRIRGNSLESLCTQEGERCYLSRSAGRITGIEQD